MRHRHVQAVGHEGLCAPKKVGLVGGLSWVSTLEYYRQINVLTNERRGGHTSAHIVIESLDEGLFLEYQNSDPTEALCERMIVDAVGVLVAGGAELVALCANGLHRFRPAIEARYDIAFVDVRDATARAIREHGLNRVGLIGVQKTMETDFFKDVLRSHGIEAVVPEATSRHYVHQKIVAELVANVFREDTREGFRSIIEELVERGAQGVILGCTEVPLLLRASHHEGIHLFSTTDMHCREIVTRALGGPESQRFHADRQA